MTTTLVLGGTGKTGRRVAARLSHDVRLGSRSGQPPFDWSDDTTWAPALDGIDSVYLSYYPDISFPDAAPQVTAFARAAADAGVTRLVLLSGRGEPDAEPAEQGVRDAGVEWTILRCSWFMQNFSEHFLLQPVLEGVIALPAGDVGEPFIDVDDLAEVAVAALTQSGHAERIYDLTGPRLVTFADAAAELSAATGREIRYLPVTPEEYAAAAVQAGVPAEEVEPLTELIVRVLDGHNAHVSGDVERVLGRPARDFTDYARDAASAGAWTADQ
jgi:uncharacterized protein YbjT (DUF2867 family)